MRQVNRQLAQSRPSDTTAVSVLSPSEGQRFEITAIFVANVDASNHDFRLFHDVNGTTYDQSTALYYDEAVTANTTKEIFFQEPIGMYDTAENLAVRSDAANDLTFTVYGYETT